MFVFWKVFDRVGNPPFLESNIRFPEFLVLKGLVKGLLSLRWSLCTKEFFGKLNADFLRFDVNSLGFFCFVPKLNMFESALNLSFRCVDFGLEKASKLRVFESKRGFSGRKTLCLLLVVGKLGLLDEKTVRFGFFDWKKGLGFRFFDSKVGFVPVKSNDCFGFESKIGFSLNLKRGEDFFFGW